VSSPAVPQQRLPTVEIIQLHMLRSSCHSCPCRTLVNCQLNYSVVSSQPPLQSSIGLVDLIPFVIPRRRGPCRQHPISSIACVTVAAGTCLLSHCPSHNCCIGTVIHTTIVILFCYFVGRTQAKVCECVGRKQNHWPISPCTRSFSTNNTITDISELLCTFPR
jgi:hypothetical protein